MDKTIGSWAFVIGLILVIILAIVGSEQNWPIYVLIVLGLIVGLMNIREAEVTSFLITAIAFMFTFASLSSVVSVIPRIGDNIVRFFLLVNAFIAPAAAVVAFKELFAHTRD